MNLKTRIRSAGMRHFSSARYQERLSRQARKRRERAGQPAVVHYFHQVDDPYSHLAVQKLDELRERYDLAFQPHLVARPEEAYQGSAAHFAHWARRDAASVAADYATAFSPIVDAPTADAVAAANAALANHLDRDDFAEQATRIGESLWQGEPLATADASNGAQAVAAGNALRESLGHYQGAMFHFDGEWFWGIDRIRLLEERLRREGFGEQGGGLCVPEPTPQDTSGLDASSITLEYFPSLRSPYTAIGHRRVLDLIARSGVGVHVRPVMPMMMRGIPAPRAKQRYIISDAGREGRAHGAPFGTIVDPFGEPVRRAFALFPGAIALGRELEFVTAYLDAAWFDGVDITTDTGLRRVVATAGMDWQDLQDAAHATDWEALLQANLATMLDEDLWGVPSFRVSGGNNAQAYACWGQDRIWRVENEIARRS